MDNGKSDRTLLIEIHAALFGVDGQGGVCRDMEECRKDRKDLWISHNSLRRNFWGLVAFLAGSGVLTGAGIAIFEAVNSGG